MNQARYLTVLWLALSTSLPALSAQSKPELLDASTIVKVPSKQFPFVYLRCRATSWNLDASSRMLPGDIDGIFTLRYTVTRANTPNGEDSCIFTAASVQDSWEPETQCFGIVDPLLEISAQKAGIAPINLDEQGARPFRVRYQQPGTYEAFLNLNEPPSLLIAPEGDALPSLPGIRQRKDPP